MNETIQGVNDTLEAGFDKVAAAFDIPTEYQEEAKAALRTEFEDLVKEAGFWGDLAGGAAKELTGGNVGKSLALGGIAMGGAALGGLASMAINRIGKSFGAQADRASYDAAFRKAMNSSEILQNDPMKAKRMADTIFGFAPTVASDANVLTNILVNSIHGDSMDLQTVRAVTELEEKLTKMRK